MHPRKQLRLFASLSVALVSAGCVVSEKSDTPPDSTAAVTPAATIDSGTPLPMPVDSGTAGMPDSSAQAAGGLRLEVDLTTRKVTFYRGADSAQTYPVAIGSEKWPTQTGDWTVKQVVWNPEWTPPDESWAEERLPRKPGDPKNPLGRAQLVYDPPRTIHGTNQPASIGKNVSHGSIRMKNEDIIKLGKELMELSGVGKDSAFYKNVATKRTEKVIVDLPKPVPIRVF